jgi:anaerobic selenocysteine-containing dehydrogenase
MYAGGTMTSRRGFLKNLVGAAPAVLAGAVVSVDTAHAETKDKTAFNFMCACGESHVAVVPEMKGEIVKVDCDCGSRLNLLWEGDHFTAFHGESRPEGVWHKLVDKAKTSDFAAPERMTESHAQEANEFFEKVGSPLRWMKVV